MSNTAIILAGGKGTRLYPITKEIPKVMIPFKGSTLLNTVLACLWKEGVTSFVVAAGEHVGAIQGASNFTSILHSSLRVVSEGPTPRGTGGGVAAAAMSEMFRVDDNVLVCNGDNLLDLDLKAMHKQHMESNADVTLAVKLVDDASGYGHVLADHANCVYGFEEKEYGGKGLISLGYYIFSLSALSRLAKKCVSSSDAVSLEKDFFPTLINDHWSVYTYLVPEEMYWSDVGTMERYDAALSNCPFSVASIRKERAEPKAQNGPAYVEDIPSKVPRG